MAATLTSGNGRDVESRIDPAIQLEIRTFEAEAQRYRDGQINDDVFKAFRLNHGIYGQRQDDVQMVRIKIPLGRITPDQLVAVADIADEFSDGILHVTTRQDFQMHWVDLDRSGDVMRRLAAAGMTTREACGNTVRNVTAAHDAGVSPDDVFNVLPWAQATSAHFLRNDVCQTLPRKFKIAFAGNEQDRAFTPIHDIGAIAVKREVDGTTEYGFRVVVGGGLGNSPHLAKPYSDFLGLDEFLPHFHAILAVFNRRGNRKNRMRARMKFLVEKLGIDEFKRVVEEERQKILADGVVTFERPDADPVLDPPDEWTPAAAVDIDPDPGFAVWYRDNVTQERRTGVYSVAVKLYLGDLTSRQMRALAKAARQYCEDTIVNTITQNMMVRSVRQENLPALYRELAKVDLVQNGAHAVGDVTACPGADTCNLGITSSRGIGRELTDRFARRVEEDLDLRGLDIKISGCPNSCGQHHIASIGLHGVSKRVDGQQAPHYQIHLGGRANGLDAAIGVPYPKVPAKRVPDLIDALIKMYRDERVGDESFDEFIDRTEKSRFREMMASFTDTSAGEISEDFYKDWGYDHEFSTDDIGVGECAGENVPIVEKHLSDGERILFQAGYFLEENNRENSVEKSRDAMLQAAQGLLAATGEQAVSDEDALNKFQHHYIDAGIMSDTFLTLRQNFIDFGKILPDTPALTEHIAGTRKFIEESRAIYTQMEIGGLDTPVADAKSGMNASDASTVTAEMPSGTAGTPKILNLKGLHAEEALKRVAGETTAAAPGAILEIWVESGDTERKIAEIMQSAGFTFQRQEPLGDLVAIIFRKDP